MRDQGRRAVVRALTELAGSDDYRDRADAGRALAGFAELPESRAPLTALLLDAGDTFVTRATAEALLRRRDAAGLTAVAAALAEADLDHAVWVETAVLDVFGIHGDERDAAIRMCETLVRDDEPGARLLHELLSELLSEINPVLPAPRGDSATPRAGV